LQGGGGCSENINRINKRCVTVADRIQRNIARGLIGPSASISCDSHRLNHESAPSGDPTAGTANLHPSLIDPSIVSYFPRHHQRGSGSNLGLLSGHGKRRRGSIAGAYALDYVRTIDCTDVVAAPWT
jgi:hypothetical protein